MAFGRSVGIENSTEKYSLWAVVKYGGSGSWKTSCLVLLYLGELSLQCSQSVLGIAMAALF